MKIGIECISSIAGKVGILTYKRSLIRELTKISPGEEFHLLTSYRKVPQLRAIFGDVPNIKYDNCFPHPKMLGAMGAPFIKFVSRPLWLKWSRQLDILHFTSPSRLTNIELKNLVVTIHDMICFYDWLEVKREDEKMLFLARQGIEYTTKHARLILVPSHFVMDEVVRYFPQSKNKIKVTYEAADDRFRRATADQTILKKYGIHDDLPFFLYVGDFRSRKNLKRLLEAFSRLPRNILKEFRLVFVGGGHRNWISELYHWVSDLSISGSFIHLENVPDADLVHFYNTAYGSIYISLSEGFGLPILEAMQSGCPVITSNCSCMPEIAGDAAILVDPLQIESIRDGMLQLIEKPNLRNEFIQKGLQRAREFSWQKTARETLKGYQAVVSGEL